MIDPDCFRDDEPPRVDRAWLSTACVLAAVAVTAFLVWLALPRPTLDVGPIPQVEARP